MLTLRPVSWLKAALKEFEAFPAEVQLDAKTALTIAARGGKADTAKPFKGVEGGVFEIALRHRGDAYRIIYAVQLVRRSGWWMRFRRSPRPGSRPRKSM